MILRYPIVLIGILLLTSCETGEIVTSDYEPELNVYGLISFDEQMTSVIYVHRTLALDENPDENLIYLVTDADVSITNSAGVSTQFIEETYHDEEETYYDPPEEFVPQFDMYYTLNVNAQDGKSLIGSLHTPPKPELFMYPDSIYPDSLFNISWNSPENSMVQIEVESWDYPGCYIYKSEYFENGETEWTTKIFSCYDNEGGYYSDNPDSLTIQLSFIDINYYDYFIRYEEAEFLNFLMGTSGSTQYAFGVEGGIGVFGSYATDKITLPFDP